MKTLFPVVGMSALAMAATVPIAAAWGQDLQDRPAPAPTSAGVPAPATDEEVTFAADQLDYDSDADIVTARGDVRMVRSGNKLRADSVSWNRKSGEVRANGNVAVTNPGGDTAYGDTVELKDTLKDGVIENLLLVLADGGRLAAVKAKRVNGVTTLEKAAYTPCAVVDEHGCPKDPVWKISAVRVVHNPQKKRIYYKDARLTVLGATILWLPGLSHPAGGEGGSGLLVPNIGYSRTNGFELALPYYLQFGPDRDLTVSTRFYTASLPMLEAHYRQLTSLGAFQIGGYLTYGSRLPASTAAGVPAPTGDRGFRGYFDANGKFQLDPNWSITGSMRVASDRTFLRRYDISRDDRLRSMVEAERIDANSYLSIAGWAVQTLRATGDQGQQPIAFPLVDYRRRLTDPWLGGRVEAQVNTLALTRTGGQDTQRAFARLQWDLRRYTAWGQELTLTAYARGDVYHTDDVARTTTAIYRGESGWTGRGIAAFAADVRWPLVGELAGGTQVLTPRVQLVASPRTRNLSIPNEDARAIELEDSNLFALNRFPGYDRWEDGTRMTYGLEWAYDRPRLSIRSVVGQSYRFSNKPSLFPAGTGLTDRWSDFVGRTSVRYGRLIELTHRFRLDKDNLNFRRNEVDLTVGTTRTYATVGYLRLNRNIDPTIEDLRDREEVRLGGRVQLTRYVSAFGSAVVDLTTRREDPLGLADGFEPVRHRLGLLYDDDCLQLGVTWRRDYDAVGDARRGNSFLLQLALKNLGR